MERIKIDFFSSFNDKLKVNTLIFKGGVYIKQKVIFSLVFKINNLKG